MVDVKIVFNFYVVEYPVLRKCSCAYPGCDAEETKHDFVIHPYNSELKEEISYCPDHIDNVREAATELYEAIKTLQDTIS